MDHRRRLVGAVAISVATACVPEGEVGDVGSKARENAPIAPALSSSPMGAGEEIPRDSTSASPATTSPEESSPGAQLPSSDAVPGGPDLILVLPWGNDARAVGRLDGDESASEGPMSFAVTAAGELYVLDQVNLRVLVFRSDGSLRREIPIPASTYQDIEVTDDGSILLLDRLARPSLLVLHESGRILAEHAVLGDGIPEGGGITAMFARDDGVWLEFAHSHVVRVLAPGLRAAARLVQPGRIYRQGIANVGAALDRARGAASIWLRDPGGKAVRARAEVSLGHPIARIISIDSDATGHIHLFLHIVELDNADRRTVTAEKVVGIRCDENLVQTGMLTSPHVITQWEQFRELRVTDAGAVYQMAFDREGVRFYRWQW